MMKDINSIACALIDGGWVPDDADLIRVEYGFDDDDLDAVIAMMKAILS